jgi:hypothetical protein
MWMPAAAVTATAVPASGTAGGINVEPSMRPTRYEGANPDGWWCVPPECFGGADPKAEVATELALAHELGVANVRVEFPWALIEPQRGGYDWSRADVIVQAARERGVVLQPVLVFTPPWAAPRLNDAPAAADFERFSEMFSARYRGTFPVIELWNEPDGGAYWSAGEPAYVADILVPGYRGVHAGDPAARVEMGAPDGDEGTSIAWFKEIYTDHGGDSFDVAAFHNYLGSAAEEAAAYLAVLEEHGQGTKQIWLGEYGVQEDATNDTQQIALMRSVLGGRAPLAMAQWYNLRDDNSVSCCPQKVEKNGHWGLVEHDDLTRKSGFDVLRGLLGSAAPSAPSKVAQSSPSDSAVKTWAAAIVLAGAAASLALWWRRRRRRSS